MSENVENMAGIVVLPNRIQGSSKSKHGLYIMS